MSCDPSMSSRPQASTPSSVTDMVKKGWETQASPQSMNEVAAVADEDLAVVEVVVLDRVGDGRRRPARAQSSATVGRAREPVALIVRPARARTSSSSYRPASGARRRSGSAERRAAVRVRRHVICSPAIEGQDSQPAAEVALALHDLPQPLARRRP